MRSEPKLIENCDIAVVRFGYKYKQWNAAFDAGYCAAMGHDTRASCANFEICD